MIVRLILVAVLFAGVVAMPAYAGAACGKLCDYEFMKGATVANVRAVVEQGADVNARDKDGLSPLHFAAAHNKNPAVVKALIQAGTDVNAQSNSAGSPLHNAARYNSNHKIIKVLIRAGADVNALTNDGLSPLHLAALNNKSPDVVRVLIEAGANIEAKTMDGKTTNDFIGKNKVLRASLAYREIQDQFPEQRPLRIV